MKNGKFLAGVIAGLGAGALLGVLFAPEKGSKTRKKLLKKSCDAEPAKANIHDIIRKNKERLQAQAEESELGNSVM
ncbi:MAG: YtxH domain-containing protein [Chitinophagaceae bacterium]|nr:MAG: YtxH domain-containing protein [Chitinophagaceae bacterium]